MKTVLERPKLLLVTLLMLSFAMIFVFGLAAREGQTDFFRDLANLIRTLSELPCKVVISLRTFPERMNPTCSECR